MNTAENIITDYYLNKAYEKGKRDALRKLLREITNEALQIDTLLTNGQTIYEQAQGTRFDKLYKQRLRLHRKISILWDIAGRILEEIDKTKR